MDLKTDSGNNILSSILLTSDLKGYIHNPAYYLQKNDKKANLAADMLMMTQGWTRYDVPKALRGDFLLPEILPEKSQVISGAVRNGLLSKPYASAKLTLVSSEKSFFEVGEADENGKFSYYMELPDSTTYLIKAMNRNGKKSMIELFIDQPVYPDINPKLNVLMAQQKLIEEDDLQEYVAKADAKYVQENGVRVVDLQEVVVKGKKTENKYKSSYASIFTERITEEQLEQIHSTTVHGILSRLPGVWATGQSIYTRRATPLILIDGMVMNSGRDQDQTVDILNSINVSVISQVEYTRGVDAAVYGPEGAGGVIEIFTKRGEFKPVTKPNINMKMLKPLGYQKPVEFYSPKYDTPEAKANEASDLRSVIYWKPDVLIDSEGKASLEFYTADSPSTYTVVVEGVTNDGKLIYNKAERFISVE
jgi:hypothetical protein